MTNYNERLDEILADHREWMRGVRTDRLVGTSSEATKQAILDWHNKQVKNAVATAEDNLDQYWNKELDKQIEGVLDRLESNKETLYWWTGGEYDKTTAVDMRAIIAERAKLKEAE